MQEQSERCSTAAHRKALLSDWMRCKPVVCKIILNRQRGLKLPVASDIRNCEKQEASGCTHHSNYGPNENCGSRLNDTSRTCDWRHAPRRSGRKKVRGVCVLYGLHGRRIMRNYRSQG